MFRYIYIVSLSVVTFLLFVFVCLKAIAMYAPVERTMTQQEPKFVRAEMVRLHTFHGITYSYYKRGQWLFERGGKVCVMWDPREKK